MKTLNLDWTANARGIDEHGTPIVAVYGSENMNAVDRSRLIQSAPSMFVALCEILEAIKLDDLKEYGEYEMRGRLKDIYATALKGLPFDLRAGMADQL